MNWKCISIFRNGWNSLYCFVKIICCCLIYFPNLKNVRCFPKLCIVSCQIDEIYHHHFGSHIDIHFSFFFIILRILDNLSGRYWKMSDFKEMLFYNYHSNSHSHSHSHYYDYYHYSLCYRYHLISLILIIIINITISIIVIIIATHHFSLKKYAVLYRNIYHQL